MIRRQYVVRDFFREAEAMREVLDSCFRDPYRHKVDWEYFCDPLMYAYLRTRPQRVIPKAIFDSFMQHLRQWCLENLGLLPMQMPRLHLMVNGCRLGLHSDFHNGAWGYVYSLTRWQNRKFSGGETLLFKDGIPSYKKHQVQGEVLYDLVPAHFNQLLVFDDRVVHATPTIEGSMDPVEGRIALVGHIRATSPVVIGHLDGAEARKVVLEALPHLLDRIRGYREVQGTITYRLTIGLSGAVDSAVTLSDNLVTEVTGYGHSDAVSRTKSMIEKTMVTLKFPPGSGKSTVLVPLLIPLPDLRPIELVVPHDLSADLIHERVVTHLAQEAPPEFHGSWEGRTYFVREPIAGSICIEAHRITASFAPPMWVPSQREHFQRGLLDWVNRISTGAVR